MTRAILLVIGAMACSRVAPDSRCRAPAVHAAAATIASNNYVENAQRAANHQPPIDDHLMQQALESTLVRLCIEDEWPDEMLRCLDAASDIYNCRNTLTGDARINLAREVATVTIHGLRNPDRR